MRAMKDSGIDWIGQIPEHWAVWRMKHLASEPLQYGANATGVEFREDIPRYIRITDISADRKLNAEGKQSLEMDTAQEYMLEDGDILFARSGATSGKSFYYEAAYGACCFAGYLIRLRTKNTKALSKFLYYYTLTQAYENWTQQIFIQATIQNISADKYNNLRFAVPESLEEQEAIVAYLDQRCSEIDALIAAKEKTNALLKERRQSIIYEAVTKGLNPDAPMKDSGIEWIGEIPEHWEVERLKHHIEFNPKTEIPEYGEDDSVSFIPMDCLRRGVHTSQTVDYSKVKSGYVDFAEGDILMAKVTPCLENGNLAIAGNLIDGVGFGSTEINVIRCKSIHREYLFYILQCKTYVDRAVADMYGVAGLKRLNPSFIPNTKYPMPSIEEQQGIAEHLAATCGEIDEFVVANERTIEKLKEYRQSVIYEAVTGKIEV